jgi:hypothetical protein
VDSNQIPEIIAFLGLAGAGIGVWVKLRERVVRAETKIEGLEAAHKEHKTDFTSLRDWLETQFDSLRREISRKADRDK